jgi:PPK2 family polyphosphate:nucleotide phosphotransferase
MLQKKEIQKLRVAPGSRVRIADYDPRGALLLDLDEPEQEGSLKERAREFLQENLDELEHAQELLWASDTYSVLVVLQAMDAAGKDGVIKHVMSGLNPQGCDVRSFKRPSDEELDHNFLWRYQKAVPERGRIGIFNRSYYEEVLVVRVHPEILERQKLPPGRRGKAFWQERFDDINAFEQHLARNGTAILKFFLNVSKKEQKKRLVERLEDPEKHWKFSMGDLEERAYWDDYMHAFEEAIEATSTKWAPWYVIPADNKWVARALVASILTTAIEDLDLAYPEVSADQERLLEKARKQLAAEE